jgi:Methionyl-tRNA synthetase
VLARYHRGRGDAVRFQAGTDDNSLKNVLAAGAAGVGVREFVDRNAEAFRARRRAVAERRRLHPDQPRPQAPARRRGPLAGLLR